MHALLITAVLSGVPSVDQFHKPVRVQGGDQAIKVEAPGYASPCFADVDGDGKKDLLVGQFADGKIKFYKGLDGSKFAEGEWLQVDGKDVEIPGVW